MLRLSLLIFTGCNALFGIPGQSQLQADGAVEDSQVADMPNDVSGEQNCEGIVENCALLSVDRVIANGGEAITLEGTFGDDVTVNFPEGLTQAATVLGIHRATVIVPEGATEGELSVNTSGTTIGSVPFRGTTFALGSTYFQIELPQAGGAKQASTLVRPRVGAPAVVANGFVYVLGGGLADIDAARIQSDGTLGPFHFVGELDVAANLRTDHATTVVGDRLVVTGGRVPNQMTPSFTSVRIGRIAQDGSLDEFSPSGSLVKNRFGHTAHVIGNKLYILGGQTETGADDSVEVATILSGGGLGPFSIVSGVKLETARTFHTSVVAGNFVYVIGGSSGDATLDSIERAAINSDGTLGSFAPIGSLVTARSGASAIVVGSSVLVMGGKSASSTLLDSVERAALGAGDTLGSFSLDAARLEIPRSRSGVAIIGDHVHLFGGEMAASGRETTIERMSLNASGALDNFSTASSTLNGTPRSGVATAVISNLVYIFGGQNTGANSGEVDRAPVSAGGSLGPFSAQIGVLSLARGQHAAAVTGNVVHILGGSDLVSFLDDVESAQIQTDGTLGTFAHARTLTLQRSFPSVAAIRNTLLIFGGNNGNQAQITNYERASIDTDGSLGTFSSAGSIQTGRSRHCTVVLRNSIYMIGGTGPNDQPLDTVERATIAANGTLGSFGNVNGVTLTAPRATVSCAVIGKFLYVVGGDAASGRVVERALINADGTIGTFNAVTALLLVRRADHDVLQFGNSLFVLSGSGASNALPTIEQTVLK